MTAMDQITDEIAHFIGLFHMRIEEARLRDAYPDFSYHAQKSNLHSQPVALSDFDAPYEFIGFDPQISYKAPIYLRPIDHTKPLSWHDRSSIPSVEDVSPAPPPYHPEKDLPGHHTGSPAEMLTIEPPGSVANYIVQAASLSDDDNFNVGGSNIEFNPQPVSDQDLLDAADEVFSQAPIDGLDMPATNVELIEIINNVASQLKALANVTSGGPTNISVQQSEAIEGIYVNGEIVEETPQLEDYHSFGEEAPEDENAGNATDGGEQDEIADGDAEEDDGQPSNVVISEDGSVTVKNSVELVAGNNTAVNEAVIQNLWTAGTVTAVVGDHVEVNTIVQTNALWDTDSVTSAVDNWTSEDTANEVFNIATFKRDDPLEDAPDTEAAAGGFPAAWAVAEIQGDLLITNWLEQYVFMSDNDVGVLSASGTTTQVIAGDNTSANQTSIFELGFSYDLIIVGGSLYDANIIHQTNVLIDNDVVGAVSGFETSGEGGIASSGNLLWNQAYIQNVGGADRFETLPSAYLDAANDFAAGNYQLSSGVLTDPMFADLPGLRVLYVSGDLLNIQYVSQTNIVGDSDQIALAMNAIDPRADATWSVSTGGNVLINKAAILDLDSFGQTYVGGGQYSQETLFQAELISHQPELLTRNPDALVNEAVVFLDETMLEGDYEAPGISMPTDHDGHYQNDGLQHVLG
ncbi:hypothetical protein ABK249_08440 [Neorhizobium sp. Rsf11]|uniref:Type I secretion protein n=2 Tax=Neorhizobium TaxID=1525371 RepID=A0ABV0LZR8_9HYPH|nr:hypothetical protein [Neorhizobium petrolearium]MCC2610888.1 hypothetical protein [Neorhizobium petrolearium]WGI71002.1 hypothetical protein QEO92_13630 [Neorhizobium petrolearium]